MKLVAQVAAGVALGIFGIWFLMAEGASSPVSSSSDRSSTGCGDVVVVSAAAGQLAEWLNQKVGKDNAFGVHGSFVAEISQSFEMGALQGTKQCFATASVGIKHAGGALVVSPGPISLHFMLTGNQVTFSDAELLSSAAETADSLLLAESIRQQQQESTATPPSQPSS